jgi:hypothetical protein
MKALHFRIVLAAALMSAAVIGAASAMTKPPAPQSTEWCAIYRGGSENCHFTSESQCAASVSGIGGFCRMSYYPSARR